MLACRAGMNDPAHVNTYPLRGTPMSSTLNALSASSASPGTLIAARWYDYIPIAIYFAFVIGVGLIARAKAATADGFLTSGRSLPAWVTGIAFVSANLGAVEIMGMSANGAEYGMPTFHYFWIGAVPAMIFLGLVMMPFYYGSKVRSVPEFMLASRSTWCRRTTRGSSPWFPRSSPTWRPWA